MKHTFEGNVRRENVRHSFNIESTKVAMVVRFAFVTVRSRRSLQRRTVGTLLTHQLVPSAMRAGRTARMVR